MTTLRLELSWPASLLWPNRKAHWAAKRQFERAARDEGYVAAKSALAGSAWAPPADNLAIQIIVTGHKPAERGQDRDGLNSALKHYYDGIAAALNVNDKRFRHVVDWGEPAPPHGRVEVEIGT